MLKERCDSMRFFKKSSNCCKLTVWENGKKEIKKFMKFVGGHYFIFPKLLADLGLSGKLDIVRGGEQKRISVYTEQNEWTDIKFVYDAPGFMQVNDNLYKVIKSHFCRFNLEKI